MYDVVGIRIRRLALSATLAAATLLATAPPARAEVAAKPVVPVPTIVWSDCDKPFQCATVEVPLDYDRPSGRTISLAMIRLPAADPLQRKGSLFINPGGPGGSGVAAVRSGGQRYPAELRNAFDLIGVDPRGIAGSTRLQCVNSEAEALAVQHPTKFPITGKDKFDWLKKDLEFAASCAANAGPILNHMSTANVARDMDLLRTAVGDKKLNYLGFSYGSYLGQTYANMFPGHVGAFVIDGVLDPVEWSTGTGKSSRTLPFTTRINSDLGSEETLEQFFTLCDQAGEGCAFSRGARARFDQLAARIKANPVQYPGLPGYYINYQALIGLTLSGMYNPAGWIDLAEFFAELEAEAAGTGGATTPSLEADPALAAAPAADYQQFEASAAVGCSDTVNPTSYRAWDRAANVAAQRAPYFGRLWAWDSSVCHFWPGHDRDRYTGPWNHQTANPVLIVGNYFDPATPYSGAVAASKLLPGSRLLSYAGWGHLAFGVLGNACIDDAVVRYLVSGVLPAEGTVCQPAASPFATGAADQSRAALKEPFVTRPVSPWLTPVTIGG